MPKNADQTPNVELVKLASQAKENVFAEEGTIEILKLEGVKISMNVYPVPNRFADLMLYAIIFLEVMSANVHLDFLEIHSADVKNVQVRKFKTIQLFSSQTIALENCTLFTENKEIKTKMSYAGNDLVSQGST